MAVTTVQSLLTQIRQALNELTANYWTDAELVSIMNLGAQDLWGAILDLHQAHYFRIDTTNVFLRANTTELTGIPQDCFRVILLEPVDTTVTATGHQIMFQPREYNHPDFITARTFDAQDLSNLTLGQIYYQVVGEGTPTNILRILTAPQVTADLAIRFVYNPALPVIGAQDVNPIPGASDNALKAWTIAYARAKETDARTPDGAWLQIYATEKQLVLTRLTPRQEQEPDVVDDLFQGYGGIW